MNVEILSWWIQRILERTKLNIQLGPSNETSSNSLLFHFFCITPTLPPSNINFSFTISSHANLHRSFYSSATFLSLSHFPTFSICFSLILPAIVLSAIYIYIYIYRCIQFFLIFELWESWWRFLMGCVFVFLLSGICKKCVSQTFLTM